MQHACYILDFLVTINKKINQIQYRIMGGVTFVLKREIALQES